VNGKKAGWLSLLECLKPKETVLLCFMQATDFVMPTGPQQTIIKDPKEISKKQLQQPHDWFYFSLVLEFHTRAYAQHLQSSNLRVPTPTLDILR
jgi:hypothetical protein